MNSLDLIENDFKLLCTELKKRNNSLKEVLSLMINEFEKQCERAMKIIVGLKTSDPSQGTLSALYPSTCLIFSLCLNGPDLATLGCRIRSQTSEGVPAGSKLRAKASFFLQDPGGKSRIMSVQSKG